MGAISPLSPDELYHACNLSSLLFNTTAELEPLREYIGQTRAVEAIDFGISIQHEGYNLYLMGSAGLGKHGLIRQILDRYGKQGRVPNDWCYVACFADPHRPVTLHLPPGRGRTLRTDLQQLVEDLLNAVPAAFQSEEYDRRAEAISKEFKDLEEKAATAVGKKAKERGIALIHTPSGYTLAPSIDGEVLKPADFDKLPDKQKERIGAVVEELREELEKALSQVPLWQKELRRRFKALNRELTEITVTQLMAELERDYRDLREVLEYLATVKQDVIDNVKLFRQGDGQEGKNPSPDDPQFTRYQVNVLVDNAELDGAPVVYEDNPTYLNLIGRIEHIARKGTLATDFTLIKPGALHRANGGYLILDANKLLTHPFAWDALKRVLRSREIRIEPLEQLLSLAGTISLEPQGIPVALKVVIIGNRLLYYLLKAYDPEFGQLFKVVADFSEDMSRVPDKDPLYARLLATLQQDRNLRPLTREAVELVIEQAARRASDGKKLSLHIGRLLDLLQESDYQADRSGNQVIDHDQVQAALDAQHHRVDQLRERLQEEILRGTILISTHGVQLGRVNGLSVVQLGDYAFGTPTRISATARVGNGEVIDIQREVEQGGPIHSKGVFILSSYLARRYAKLQPLCLSASLAFEQTYNSVEGDSASLAELCALLSAIGDIPLKQSFAVTGSVNQHGEVQAIGGVCAKIEGFFDICRERGLSGAEGVIIPDSNCDHLMLKKDVIEAATSGTFNIYAVRHVDQAMELLTGQPSGIPDAGAAYPANSINGQIQLRLAEFFSVRQQLSGHAKLGGELS